MNKYRGMTYVLVVGNIFVLVSMFIAAFWGFTYPTKKVDLYESGKSAYVATFMCFLSCICLCGLNFQNYYLLVTYAVLHLLVMLNQLFGLLPFDWTRITNYPMTGSAKTQNYITLMPNLMLVTFALGVAYKLRRDERRYELASTGGLHQRLPCHIVSRPEPNRCQPASLNSGTMFGATECQAYGTTDRGHHGLNGNHVMSGPPPLQQPPPPQGPPHGTQHFPYRGMISGPPPGPSPGPLALPPPIPSLPPPPPNHANQIVQTPPIYPLHRPSVTDVSINSPARPLPMCHRPSMPHGTCAPVGLGQLSSSCGGGLNGLGQMYQETDSLTRTRSSGMHGWHHHSTGPASPYEQPGTPTKWWPSTSAKQQHYRPYYRDVYNPNF